MKNKPLNIFIVNCDWRDIFTTDHVEFVDKLKRDQLGHDINNFYLFSWARVGYGKTNKNYRTIHVKTKLDYFRPLLDLYTIPRVFVHVLRNRIKSDVWLCYDFGFVPALWLVKMFFGGKIVMCLNNQPSIYSNTRRFGSIKKIYSSFIESAFSKLVDRFFTINTTMKEYIAQLGVPKEKIFVFAMNTIERDKEHIALAKRGVIRNRYNIPSDGKIILTVARLEAEKNYHKMLELFSGLNSNYYMFILGRGSLMDELKQLTIKLGIENRVFFQGFVNRDEIWNYFMDANIFMLLSKAEALGVVFWEAMYAKVPILGSNVDGIVESIGKDGDRGRIWFEETGQTGFNSIVYQIENNQEMLERANKYVKDQISNMLTINDIV